MSETKQTTAQRASVNGTKAGSAYAGTIAAIRILMSGQVSETALRPKDGESEGRIVYTQNGIMIGGDRQLNFTTKVFGAENRSKMLKEGVYIFGNNVFKLDPKYGDLQFRAFAEDYVYLRELDDDERAMFAPKQTSIDDLVG